MEFEIHVGFAVWLRRASVRVFHRSLNSAVRTRVRANEWRRQ